MCCFFVRPPFCTLDTGAAVEAGVEAGVEAVADRTSADLESEELSTIDCCLDFIFFLPDIIYFIIILFF